MRLSTFRKTTAVLYGASSSYSSCLAFCQLTATIPMVEQCCAIRGSSLQRKPISTTFRWRAASIQLHRTYSTTHDRSIIRLLSMTFSSQAWSILPSSSSLGSMVEDSASLLSAQEASTSSPPGNGSDDEDDSVSRLFRVYYNDVYEVRLPPKHRFPMKKYRMVRERIQQQLLQQQQQQQQQRRRTAGDNAKKQSMATIEFVVSPLATTEELLTTHDLNYIQRFLTGNQTATEQRNVGFPWSPQGVNRALSSVGGTLAAACWVCAHEAKRQHWGQGNPPVPAWAAHIAGGTHHAFWDYGEGFSVFSDIAVAVNVVLERYPEVLRNNILIVDLDVHQGNGNAVLFQDKPNVFTFSMHCSGNYFSAKQRSDLDIELPIGCNDSTYLMTLHHWLKEFRRQHDSGDFMIDLVVFQAGVDVLDADRLGRMSLSPDGVRRRNQLVYQFVHDIEKPLVICMGGGYPKYVSNDNDDGEDGWHEIIDAHANVYLQAFDFCRVIETKCDDKQ